MSDPVQSKDLVGRGFFLACFVFACVCCLVGGFFVFGWVFFLPAECCLNPGNTQPFCFGWASKIASSLKILICSIW